MGGFYGARLAAAGHDVHFLLHSDYDHVQQHGLILESPLGDVHGESGLDGPEPLPLTTEPVAAHAVDFLAERLLAAEAPDFYYAEDYHQQYLAKNPNGYCGLGGTGVSCPVGLAQA